MSGTPDSSQSSFITVAQFLNRKDWRAVAQLCMDDGTQATEASLATNQNLLTILMEASGEVESSLVASNRYSVADLQAVNGVSQTYLQGIVADIAMYKCFGRRDAPGPPETVMQQYAEALTKIENLRNGTTVLSFIENKEAGVATNEYMQVPDLLNLNLFSNSCSRSLGNRNAFRRKAF